jgi:hypothetical protein
VTIQGIGIIVAFGLAIGAIFLILAWVFFVFLDRRQNK